jgi:sulfur carrier protein ThiS adenylyltransferase
MAQPIVSVSGVAGYGRSNEITTKQLSSRLILVGDDVSGVGDGTVLTSTRVGLAAYHQANAIVEVIIDKL